MVKKDFSKRTVQLWNKVVEKYGQHEYNLAVSGLGELLLTRRYGATIAKGNGEIQKALRQILIKE